MSNETKSDGAVDYDRAAARMSGAAVSIVALAVIAFGGLIRPDRMSRFFEATSPGLMPTAVLSALVICGLILVIHPDSARAERFSWRSYGVKLAALLYLFAYTWLLSAIGWLWASVGLMATLPLLAGYRNPVGIVLATVLVVASIWLVFIVGVGAPLP